MIRHGDTAVAIKYITTIQGYEWTPVASLEKCYGIRVYIDGHPNSPALTATYTTKDCRDMQLDQWVELISSHEQPRPRPNTGPM